MHAIVPIIILAIIVVQFYFFVKNYLRMKQFSRIFTDESSWRLRRNSATDFVDGVEGNGNDIFASIINSINKYLGNNSGSVIDFGLLKDAVDRHCDSVENDISTQTPIPLYWGLAGTMAGVILGLWDLLSSNAILSLMGSGVGQISVNAQQAARGIDSLLSGVAWAMGASICGIVLTTINSILFKKCKLEEETGKNSFLAWMQSELLPELPSDTSDALNRLVKNLNEFNSTFASNTTNLGNALNAVNQSYAIQADIIQAVHDMDVMKMAKANVRVLEELKECTDKLEKFNVYLSDIEGYTDAIHRFEEQFTDQAERLYVLEEIRDFFQRHKSEIAKTTADADKVLQDALGDLRAHTTINVNELQNRFVMQSEEFKKILQQEKEAFEEFITSMRSQFDGQISQMPQLARQLEGISAIPSHLDKLLDKIEKSNSKMVSEIARTLNNVTSPSHFTVGNDHNGQIIMSSSSTPSWMKWGGFCALVIIAIACIFNIVIYFFPSSSSSTNSAVEPQTTEVVEVVEDSLKGKLDASQNNLEESYKSSEAPKVDSTTELNTPN